MVSTATTTTIPTSPCPGVNNCTDNPNCSACLSALLPIIVEWNDAGTFAYLARPFEISFFETLANPPCVINDVVSPLLPPAIIEMHEQTCPQFNSTLQISGLRVPACLESEFDCAMNPNCRLCLRDIYTSVTANDHSDLLNGSSCRATDPYLLNGLGMNCASFPQCTFAKLECESDSSHNCSSCVALLREGDATGATQLCSEPPSSRLIDSVVSSCTARSNTGCSFVKARCINDRVCNGCLAAVIDAQTPEAFASSFFNSSLCVAMTTNQSLEVTRVRLMDVFDMCALLAFSTCQFAAFACVMTGGTACLSCLTSELPSPSCTQLLEQTQMSASCHPCTSSVYENNRIVMATSAVAGMSILPCLFVIIVIVAYSKDLIYIRARIIIGIMISNMVYSIGGAIPVALLQTDPKTCGQFALSFATIRFGRAWWFGGKYALIFFELFILGVSIWVIMRGVLHMISPRREVLLHALCALAGSTAFVVFMVKSTEISANGYDAETQAEAQLDFYYRINFSDDLDDDTPNFVARGRFQSARNDYDRLVQRMLVAWSCLLGLAIVLWVYLRWIFAGLTARWSVSLADAEKQWDRDLWAPSQQGIRQSKRRLLELIKEGYDELARPLEPFVAIFIFFGIPACVMATDFCKENS